MKLAAREDLSAPIEAVFQQLSDFEGFERSVLRRGAEMVRTDTLAIPGVGMSWRTEFDFRGRSREAHIELTDFEHPDRMGLHILSSGLDIIAVVDLVEMSKARTRMSVSTEIKPRTLAARLMLKSMKFARQKLQSRFRKKMGEFAVELEGRCHA